MIGLQSSKLRAMDFGGKKGPHQHATCTLRTANHDDRVSVHPGKEGSVVQYFEDDCCLLGKIGQFLLQLCRKLLGGHHSRRQPPAVMTSTKMPSSPALRGSMANGTQTFLGWKNCKLSLKRFLTPRGYIFFNKTGLNRIIR